MSRNIIYLATCLLLLSACGAQEETGAEKKEASIDLETYIVEIDTVSSRSGVDNISLTGVVSTDEEAKPAFKTGGVVSAVLVSENEDVRKGQVIARLNLTEINARVAQADLAVQKAMRDLGRVKNLYQDSVATLEQYQNAQTGLDIAEKEKEVAGFNRRFSEVKAPISGRIIRKLVNSGEVVGPGQPICIIQGTQTKDWQIKASLTDNEWAAVKVGDEAEVSFSAYPQTHIKAKVTELSTMANPGSGTFPVTLKLAPNKLRLASGLIAQVDLRSGNAQSKQMSIPLTAIVRVGGQEGMIFVPGPNGTAEARTIKLGAIQHDRIEVTAGLQSGDTVITTGAAWLRHGDPIALANLK